MRIFRYIHSNHIIYRLKINLFTPTPRGAKNLVPIYRDELDEVKINLFPLGWGKRRTDDAERRSSTKSKSIN
jgi:hypothetical protein